MNTSKEKSDACCDSGAKVARGVSAPCPACGKQGRTVQPITIESLVDDETRRRVGRSDGFRFCAETSCELAYFQPETGARIAKHEVRVRIGQKETQAPRPVCYCFGHTVEQIEAEVQATGTSKIADDITAQCRRGLDRCEETNPQGSCCLGNVRGAVRAAPLNYYGGATRRPRNTGLWATAGAVISATLSSACCWLPLLLIAFGASAGSIASFFEAYRPHLLGATGLLLASGFYLVYFRKEQCAPGAACALPNPRLRRFNKIMLWAAATVVLSFSLFPNYVGYLLGAGDPRLPATVPAGGGSRVFRIEGMTCEACAVTLRRHLSAIPGVARAEVSFEAKTAGVFFAAQHDAPSEDALRAAIQQAGYTGTPVVNHSGGERGGR